MMFRLIIRLSVICYIFKTSVFGTGVIYYNLLNEIYKGQQPIFLQASQPLHIREETPRSKEEAPNRSNGMPRIIYTNQGSPRQITVVSKPTNSITRPNNSKKQPTNPIVLQSHPINRPTMPITLQPNSISGHIKPIQPQSKLTTKLPNSIHMQSNKVVWPTNSIPRPTNPIGQQPHRKPQPSSSPHISSNAISKSPASVTPTRCHHTICKIHHHIDKLKSLPNPFDNIQRFMERPTFVTYPRPIYEHNFPIFDVNVDEANYLT